MNGSRALESSCKHRRGLGHLEQRIDAFLHSRAAARGEAYERDAILVGDANAADEALADHRSHRAAHETEFEHRDDQRHRADAALHHHQRIGFAGLFKRGRQALGILARVLELQAVDRQHLGADLVTALRIEQLVDTLARGQPV